MGVLRTALYCRLSKEDMAQGDSESIKTQKAMLTQYAREHGFLVVEVYVDDGWSGLNFDRPDFNRMLDDIEAGKIDVVITKDLSRLGRDHLKVGHFTEIYFPMKNVRYIAVNDCVDTANKNNDIVALKNVMNEFYSRDNSRKIRSSIRARAKAGLYRSSFNPIGYRKALYTALWMGGELDAYLADIDQQAQEMLFQLVKEYAHRQGITERLKAENQMKWVGRMNNCKAQAEEAIMAELIMFRGGGYHADV